MRVPLVSSRTGVCNRRTVMTTDPAPSSRFTASPSITDHDGSGWHLHYRDPDAGFAATLAGATTAAAAQYLTDRGMHRIRRCAAMQCTRAFVDFSRPGSQRYCCHRCANRDAVRRHRMRVR